MTTLTVDTKTIRLVLKMPRFFGVRMWCAIQLIKLAGLVAPVTIEASVEGAPQLS